MVIYGVLHDLQLFCARQELKLLPDLDEATTIRLTMQPPGNPKTDGIAMAYPLVN